MKIILALLFLSISTSVFALDEKTLFEDKNKIYAAIIISTDNSVAKSAAQNIINSGTQDQNLLDLVAEALYENINKKNSQTFDVDLMAWQVKALGMSGQQRYKPIIESLISNAGGDKKLIKYGQSSLEMLNATPQTPYQPNPELLNHFRKNLLFSNEVNPALTEKYFAIPLSSSLEDVLSKIGMPNLISMEESNVINAGAPGIRIRIKTKSLVLSYFGYGKIFFNQNKVGAQEVSLVSNVYHLTKNIKDQKSIDMIETLLSSDWIEMTQKISRNTNKDYSDFVYDIATERLLETVNSRAAYEERMLAHLARFIGNSENPKYLAALNQAKELVNSKSVKKHFNVAIDTINASGKRLEGASYTQGDINIGKFVPATHVF